jgi:hypothetical protein
MNYQQLIARVKAILLVPASEWPVIAAEPATVAGLYKGYIAILAAIPPVAAFLQGSVLGTQAGVFGTFRVGIGTGLALLITSYALGLLAVYLLALLVNALAPTCGGQQDRLMALKVVAYALTASWLAGVGQLLPALGTLLLLAGGLYSIYLLYLGLPVTMKCEQDKALGYTVVTVIAGIVLGGVIGAVVGNVFGRQAIVDPQNIPGVIQGRAPALEDAMAG